MPCRVFCVAGVSWSVVAGSARTLSKHASKETNSNKPRTNKEQTKNSHVVFSLQVRRDGCGRFGRFELCATVNISRDSAWVWRYIPVWHSRQWLYHSVFWICGTVSIDFGAIASSGEPNNSEWLAAIGDGLPSLQITSSNLNFTLLRKVFLVFFGFDRFLFPFALIKCYLRRHLE